MVVVVTEEGNNAEESLGQMKQEAFVEGKEVAGIDNWLDDLILFAYVALQAVELILNF